jgi:hypothetical protein
MNRLVRSLAVAAAVASLAPSTARAHAGPRHAPPPPAAIAPPAAPPRVVRARLELDREYRQLDRARRGFYARWHGDRREQRRFERWYAERRAALDRESARLAAWASRDPRHGRDGHRHGHDCD